MKNHILLFSITLLSGLFFSCTKNDSPQSKQTSGDTALATNTLNNAKIRIGFLDIVEDATLAQAREGFVKALAENGYEDKKNIEIIFRNAQGDMPTLTQAVDYFVSEKVDLIAANTTVCAITAVQRNKEIPVCMMVAPSPEAAKLTDSQGNPPKNLFGVYETLDYIDTAVSIIPKVFPSAKKLGAIYNQAEPQSQNALAKLKAKCQELGIALQVLPVNNSSETQLVTQALLNKKIDAFFALPDNVVFSSFETIVKGCNNAIVPIFTCEAGLVSRGALAGFGANMYQWGYSAGLSAVDFLRSKTIPKISLLTKREKMKNMNASKYFGIKLDSSFVVVK